MPQRRRSDRPTVFYVLALYALVRDIVQKKAVRNASDPIRDTNKLVLLYSYELIRFCDVVEGRGKSGGTNPEFVPQVCFFTGGIKSSFPFPLLTKIRAATSALIQPFNRQYIV